MNRFAIKTSGVAIVFLIGLMHGAWAQAQETAADFYKKNHVTLVVPFGPGGGTDFYGRVLSSYWPDATNGATAIVKNMPGGGTLLAMNSVFSSKPDGLTVAVCPSGTSLTAPALFKDPAVKFDLDKINWIGLIPYDPVAFSVGVKSPYKSVADLQGASGLKFGSIEGTPSYGDALVIEFFALKNAAVIVGYKSTPDTMLAVARGEIDGTAVNIGTIKQNVDANFIKPPLVTIDFKRADLYKDTPAISELAKLSPENENILKLFTALHGGLTLWAPPGVPADRLQYLRDSFDNLVKLAGTQALIKQRVGMWLPPVGAKDLAAQMQDILKSPQADVDRFNKVINKYTK